MRGELGRKGLRQDSAKSRLAPAALSAHVRSKNRKCNPCRASIINAKARHGQALRNNARHAAYFGTADNTPVHKTQT